MESNAAYAVKKLCLGAMSAGFILKCTALSRDSIRRWKAVLDQEERKWNISQRSSENRLMRDPVCRGCGWELVCGRCGGSEI